VPPTAPAPTDEPDVPVTGSNATASVGSRVWLDANQNGIQDPGEGNILGVKVHLFTADGMFVATQITDANGEYLFTGLPAGEYYIEFELPEGFTVTAQNAGISDEIDNDVDPITGRTEVFTLIEGEQNPTLDIGLFMAPTALEFGTEPGQNLAPTALESISEPGMQFPVSLFLPLVGRNQFKNQPAPLDLFAQLYTEIACVMIADLEKYGQSVPPESILGQLQSVCIPVE